MNYTRVLFALIPCFSSLQSSQFYFDHVIKQLKAGSFQSDCKHTLHLAGPNTAIKEEIIHVLVSQSQCTLIRLDIAQVVATLNPEIIHSSFQQIHNSSGGIILCIDNIELLSLSSTYRNITDALWTECFTCWESCHNVLIVFMANECRELHPQFRSTCRCIKRPIVPQFPPIILPPPLIIPPTIKPTPPPPIIPKLPSLKKTPPHRFSRTLKGTAAIGGLTLLWLLTQQTEPPPPVKTPNVPSPKPEKKPQAVTPEPVPIPPASSTWKVALWPYVPRIVTTLALVAYQEVSRIIINSRIKTDSFDENLSDKIFNNLEPSIQQTIKDNNIFFKAFSSKDTYALSILPQYILVNKAILDCEWPILDFPIAYGISHCLNKTPEQRPIIEMAIIIGVPCLLELYHQATQYLFNKVITQLNENSRTCAAITKVKKVHAAIVTSSITQTLVTFALQAAYSRKSEQRAHQEALEMTGLTSRSQIKSINKSLQKHAERRRANQTTWLARLKGRFESIPLFNPHVDSIPLPPTQNVDMQTIRSYDERRS